MTLKLISDETELKWESIYYKEYLINYRGTANETWSARVHGGWLIRHAHYHLNEGDESNRVETMVFVPLTQGK